MATNILGPFHEHAFHPFSALIQSRLRARPHLDETVRSLPLGIVTNRTKCMRVIKASIDDSERTFTRAGMSAAIALRQ